MSESCVANPQWGYIDLFLSWFSESSSPFSQSGLYLEEFVFNVVILPLLPFCKKYFIYLGLKLEYGMEILSGLRSKADLASESALSFPLTRVYMCRCIYIVINNKSKKENHTHCSRSNVAMNKVTSRTSMSVELKKREVKGNKHFRKWQKKTPVSSKYLKLTVNIISQ